MSLVIYMCDTYNCRGVPMVFCVLSDIEWMPVESLTNLYISKVVDQSEALTLALTLSDIPATFPYAS
jgi:hypothetical protein